VPFRLTMSDIRTQCLNNVDMATDESVTTAEANAIISDVYCSRVYLTVASAFRRYFETSTTFTTTGLSYLAEPSNHLSTVDTIERVLDSSGRLRRLQRIMPQERAVWSGRTGHARKWEIVDDRIYLYPTPPSGDQYVLRYIQQPPSLANYGDADVVDVVTPDGLAVVIWGASVRLKAKSDRDVGLALKERDEAATRLLLWAQDRAANDQEHIVVEDDCDDDPRLEGSYWYDR